LTAEAVSEHLNRALYSVSFPVLYPAEPSLTVQISSGELPIKAAELEEQLSRIFQIASHWKAILLLDEADVFLEKRSTQDIHRNGLVSVFLRKLEYCEGIIFLTTNRVTEFDEAILSRMHLVLRYDDLSKDAGKKIWEQFIKMANTSKGPARISVEELNLLVNSKLNGRQVRSPTVFLQS
jgi:SpoVK/Ycf46/Vps4 family AAA+-type ATPase